MDSKVAILLVLLGFLILTPTPLINTIQPDYGLNTEIVQVKIGGDKIEDTATVKLCRSGEKDIVGSKVEVSDKKHLICNFDLNGVKGGKWDVVISNKNRMTKKEKTATLINGFEICYPQPAITMIEPDYGLNNVIIPVKIRGKYLRDGAKVFLDNQSNGPIEFTKLKIISGEEITGEVDLRGARTGIYDLKIVNPDDQSGILTEGFAIGNPAPVVNQVEPNYGLPNHKVTCKISGACFRPGINAFLFRGDRIITGLNVRKVSNTGFTCDFDLDGTAPGFYAIKAVNDDGKSGLLKDCFQVGKPAPLINSIEPTRGIKNKTVNLVINGKNFRSGAKVFLERGNQSIEGNEVAVISDSAVKCQIDLKETTVGNYNLRVINDDGQTAILKSVFTVEYPAPSINKINPISGLNNQLITAGIYGNGFREGIEVWLENKNGIIEGTSVELISDREVQCRFNLKGNIIGFYDVKVRNDDGKSAVLKEKFTIEYPTPVIKGITPENGLNNETMVAVITGSGFRDGIKVSLQYEENTVEGTDIQVNSGTEFQCCFDLVGVETGVFNLTVMNDDGKSNTLPGAFQVEYPAPHIFSIEPEEALNKGAITTTIKGENFRAGLKIALIRGDQIIEGSEVNLESSEEISGRFELLDIEPGSYDLKVINDDQKTAVLEAGFEVKKRSLLIESIKPDQGFNNGAILVYIQGRNFDPGLTVKLIGQEIELSGQNIKVEQGTKITCFLDITGKPVGSYDLMVINPDQEKAVLENGFRIKEYTPSCDDLNNKLKPVFFDFDKEDIREDQLSGLENNLKLLSENSGLYILLGGHADERGSREYNLDLSARRGEAIKDYLVKAGIDPERVTIYAYGKDYPIKKGHDETAWWYNRRVDILVWEEPPTKEQGLLYIDEE